MRATIQFWRPVMVAERRTAKRYRTCGRVEIPRVLTRVPLYGVVTNVSASGCGVRVPAGLDFDETDLKQEAIWLELKFKTSYLSFCAVAAVRSLSHGEGESTVSVEFVELNERARRDIAGLIRDQEEMQVAA